MPIYRKPEEKASETVTVRLTIHERRMLDHLASLEEKTLTDFLRGLIFKRAEELNITEPPPPKPKRKPGRPKMKRAAALPKPTPSVEPEESAPPVASKPPAVPTPSAPPPPVDDDIPIFTAPPEESPSFDQFLSPPTAPDQMTVRQLIERFKETFVHRADGTKQELKDAVAFFFSTQNGPPIIPPDLPVEALSSDRLKAVRDAVKESDLRFAKKNLHLTYLRMMLHFAVKEPEIKLRVNPSRVLEPLTIAESNEGWRFFAGPPK
jgi:hypothetical protein